VNVKQLKTIKMKRNEEKVPGFDEIVFENRNKAYGAYNLRKRYKSTTCLSTLGAVLLTVIPILALSFNTEPGTATTTGDLIVLIEPDNIPVEIIKPPEEKMPRELIETPKNIAPEITADTTMVTDYIPISDVLIETISDGVVEDTLYVVNKPADIVPEEPEIFIRVEEMPEFPGGEGALLSYIAQKTVYPEEAIMNNIKGRVTLKFVVNPDGSVGKIELIRGIDPLLDQEAIRVVSTLPRFRPGKQNGIAVPVWYSVPVNFRITEMN